MTRRQENKPTTVPFGATPAGEPPSVEDWANRGVWTDRMLTALHSGVRGGRWHTLIDRVYQPLTLYAASTSVLAKAGAAGRAPQTGPHFPGDAREELHAVEGSALPE